MNISNVAIDLNSLISNLVLFSLCMLGASVLTGLVRSYAFKANIMDRPNERSSHTVPTPRGGGAAVVIVLAVAIVAEMLRGRGPVVFLGACTVTFLAMAVLGWVDDRRGLSARLRLVVQLLCAAVVLFAIAVTFTSGFSVLFWIICLLFVVWMTNLYNFMDGIDGILGIQVLTVALSTAGVLYLGERVAFTPVLIAISGSAFGFLFWNWSPAKIFMGDVGSASLGFLLAAIDVVLVAAGDLSVSVILILNAAFVGDATCTLAVRFLRKKKVYQAHRTHLYQKLTLRGWKHSSVALLFGVFNLAWLLPCGLLAENFGHGMIAVAYIPVLFGCVYVRAGMD